VFLVNAARGTGNRRDTIRIAGGRDDDDISVAVGDYRSEADEDAAAREREETKRLFYVALTRARDRLYLSTALKEGRVQPGRGSLAEVWPASLLDAFVAAYTGSGQVEWIGTAGAVHTFHVVSGFETPPLEGGRPEDRPQPTDVATDFDRIVDTCPVRRSVATVVAASASGVVPDGTGAASDLLLGLLVHRLLQRFGMTVVVEDGLLISTVEAMLRRERHVDAAVGQTLLRDIIARFHALRAQAALREQYETGEVFHEVPFTFSTDGQIVRGAIDCVIRQRDGSVRILEFKTGRRRDEHGAQAELYRRAAAAVFPDEPVVVEVVYALDPTVR